MGHAISHCHSPPYSLLCSIWPASFSCLPGSWKHLDLILQWPPTGSQVSIQDFFTLNPSPLYWMHSQSAIKAPWLRPEHTLALLPFSVSIHGFSSFWLAHILPFPHPNTSFIILCVSGRKGLQEPCLQKTSYQNSCFHSIWVGVVSPGFGGLIFLFIDWF